MVDPKASLCLFVNTFIFQLLYVSRNLRPPLSNPCTCASGFDEIVSVDYGLTDLTSTVSLYNRRLRPYWPAAGCSGARVGGS